MAAASPPSAGVAPPSVATQLPMTACGVPGSGTHAQPTPEPAGSQSVLSIGIPPQAGGLPEGQAVWHVVLDGPPLLATVMQHHCPGLQSPAAPQAMLAEPLGQAAAFAAQVPCTLLPIGVRQHTWVPRQLGQSFIAVRAPLLPAPLLPVPLLLAVPPWLSPRPVS